MGLDPHRHTVVVVSNTQATPGFGSAGGGLFVGMAKPTRANPNQSATAAQPGDPGTQPARRRGRQTDEEDTDPARP